MYQPKGSMCMSCNRRDNDCSELIFESMPIIEKLMQFGNDVVIVKCAEFTRRSTAIENELAADGPCEN